MKWLLLIILGILIALLAMYDWYKTGNSLTNSHVLLIALAIGLIFIAIFKPDRIKLWDVELRDLKREAVRAAELSEDNARLAIEAAAVSVWNQSRLGAIKNTEDLATEMLRKEYGDKAEDVKNFLQHKGILLTPQAELATIPQPDLDPETIPIIYKLKSQEDNQE